MGTHEAQVPRHRSLGFIDFKPEGDSGPARPFYCGKVGPASPFLVVALEPDAS